MKFWAICLTAFFCFNDCLLANDLGSPYEKEVQKTLKLLKTKVEKDTQKNPILERILDTNEKDKEGYIRECDVQPKNCRKDNVLLFRGEKEFRDKFALASAVYTRWSKKSTYAPQQNAKQFLETLRDDFHTIRPYDGDNYSDDHCLKYKNTNPYWYFCESNDTKIEQRNILDTSPQWSYFQILYALHSMEKDIKFEKQSLDPLVSFSKRPAVALGFCEEEKCPLIVLSIPKSEIVRNCPEHILPTQVIDPKYCQFVGDYADEKEVSAVMYPKPEHIWKVIEVNNSGYEEKDSDEAN